MSAIEHKPHKSQREDQYISQFSGNDWGEKLSFTVGVSFMFGTFLT